MKQRIELILRKGVDYYIENGTVVLTRFYHLKRGACCGSSCRHCPYLGGRGSRIRKVKVDN